MALPELESPEEFSQAQQISRADAAQEARRLLLKARHGALATLSRHDGAPFGSVAPYAVAADGSPIFLFAGIAEHTKNLRADPRASLLVAEPGAGTDDVQAHGRLTLVGTINSAPVDMIPELRARYLARLPEAQSYFKTHDFSFYTLLVRRARYIGGFGKIFWLEADALAIDPARDPLQPVSRQVLDHMNQDHRDALVLLVRAQQGLELEAQDLEMVGIDTYGMDVACRTSPMRFRFEFPQEGNPQNVRSLVVGLVAEARKKLVA